MLEDRIRRWLMYPAERCLPDCDQLLPPRPETAHGRRSDPPAERRRAAAVPTVGEAVDAVRVVAQQPVAQRLAIYAGRARSVLPAHAVSLPNLERGHKALLPNRCEEGITNRHQRGMPASPAPASRSPSRRSRSVNPPCADSFSSNLRLCRRLVVRLPPHVDPHSPGGTISVGPAFSSVSL